MMTTMRSQMKTILWILVFAFIGTIVFSWGMGGFKDREEQGVIAKFAGQTMTYENFELYIQRKQDMALRKDSTASDEAKQKQLREDAWDEEIERQLKELDAERQGIKVVDKEIAFIVQNYPPNEVRQVPSFQREGQFAPDLYHAFLRTPDASEFLLNLEASVRNYLLEQKTLFYVHQASDVSELTVRDEWMRAGVRGKLSFVSIPFDRVDVDSTSVTEDQLRRYYNLFPDRYKQFPQRRFAYVKFKIEATGEDSIDVVRTAEELMTELRSGADFASLAMIHSEDAASNTRGGDLDWVARGTLAKPVDDAVFAAQTGEMVGPITSRLGVHVVQVLEKKTEDGAEKVHARQILLKIKASPDTRDAVYSMAYAFAQDAQQKGFETVANEGDYKVDTTKAFSEAGYISGLGRMRMAAEFCFNNPVGTVGDVYPIPDGYVIFKITEATEETVKPFEEVKDAISKAVLKILRQQRAMDIASGLRAKMNNGSDLSSVASTAGYQVYETADSAKVDERLPDGLRADKDFITQAFRVANNELSDVIEGRNGCYIAYMTNKTPFRESDYETSHFAIYGDLVTKERDAVAKNWIRELRIAADIQDYRHKYFRDF